LPFDQLDRRLIPIEGLDLREIAALRADYAALSCALGAVRMPVRRSDLLASIAWASPQTPREAWTAALAPNAGLTLHRPRNGLWWLAPSDAPTR
jgi:hypothetical protein